MVIVFNQILKKSTIWLFFFLESLKNSKQDFFRFQTYLKWTSTQAESCFKMTTFRFKHLYFIRKWFTSKMIDMLQYVSNVLLNKRWNNFSLNKSLVLVKKCAWFVKPVLILERRRNNILLIDINIISIFTKPVPEFKLNRLDDFAIWYLQNYFKLSTQTSFRKRLK